MSMARSHSLPARLALSASASLLALACSSGGPTTTFGPAPSAAPRAEAPPLAAIQTRDRVVRLYAAGGELQVSVQNEEGNLLADHVTLDRLRALDPFLYDACTSAVARGAILDARLYPEDVAPASFEPGAR
jgi:hypothetical protein